MHLLTTHRLGLALASCVSVVVAACASPTIPDDGSLDDGAGAATANKKPTTTKKPTTKDGNAAPEGDPSTGTSAPAKAPATTPSTPATPPSTSQCAGQTGDACFDCCNQASGGALAPADNVFGQCACGTGGQCTSVCDANLCSGAGADAPCSSCLQATCAPAEAAACTSAACKAGLQCMHQCN